MSNLTVTSRSGVLSNIRAHVEKIDSIPTPSLSPSDVAAAEARLSHTLAELQSHITKERSRRDELKLRTESLQSVSNDRITDGNGARLRSSEGPSNDPATRLRQIRAITNAYRQLAEREPEMPQPNSSLPTLLALRTTATSSLAAQQCLRNLFAELRVARGRLLAERSEVRDNRLLQEALRSRVQTLRSAAESIGQKSVAQTAEEIARKRLLVAEGHRRASDSEARQCTRALVRFIDHRLAPMLAAEELGGPVAGTEPNMTEEEILAGFTAQGQLKKSKSRVPPSEATETNKSRQERMRQQRIDTIWGPARDNAENFADEDETDAQRTEVEVAAREMRDLVQSLIDAVSQPDADTTSYVRITRDSAAARFLVRANVAVLHRTDAKRIRLQDYGRLVAA